MYHIKRRTEYFNGRATMMNCYEITDDSGLIIESTASEETMKYYESLNREERKRKEVNKMNSNIRDIDKLRRIEDYGLCYDNGLTYVGKLFIMFDPDAGKQCKIKHFYFLSGPFYRNQMNNILNRLTAKEFDDYMKNPDNSRFRFVPARIENI